MDLKKLSWLGMLFFIIGLSFSQVVMADGFPDIKNHWAEESIEVWLARGYVNGYPDGHFRPDDFITQAEFCALFNRVFGFKVGADYPGKDVPEGKWYTAEMKRAIAAGYLSSDGKLDPQGIITRKQVAISLGRVLSLSAVPRDHYSQFKDLGEIDLATAMAINTVLDKNIWEVSLVIVFIQNKALPELSCLQFWTGWRVNCMIGRVFMVHLMINWLLRAMS